MLTIRRKGGHLHGEQSRSVAVPRRPGGSRAGRGGTRRSQPRAAGSAAGGPGPSWPGRPLRASRRPVAKVGDRRGETALGRGCTGAVSPPCCGSARQALQPRVGSAAPGGRCGSWGGAAPAYCWSASGSPAEGGCRAGEWWRWLCGASDGPSERCGWKFGSAAQLSEGFLGVKRLAVPPGFQAGFQGHHGKHSRISSLYVNKFLKGKRVERHLTKDKWAKRTKKMYQVI